MGALSSSAGAKERVSIGDRICCDIFWHAVSTDETSYEAGIKVQIHSQDEPPFIDQLGFGVAPGFQTFVSCQQQLVPNVQPPPLRPPPFPAPLHSVFVPKSSPASAHYLCVSEPGAKSDCWFKCAVKVLYKHPGVQGTHLGFTATKEYW